jgi:hypothetical protein
LDHSAPARPAAAGWGALVQDEFLLRRPWPQAVEFFGSQKLIPPSKGGSPNAIKQSSEWPVGNAPQNLIDRNLVNAHVRRAILLM